METEIHKWSASYQITRYYVRFIQWLFYKKILIKGLEKIPTEKPVIFALNHQNAIMDALAVACAIPFQPVFMARADSFQNKIIARLLNWIKIMPIYRQRDGFKNLQKNELVFNNVFEIIKAKGTIALMPEGTHLGKYQLQPLLKGIFRMVFMFKEKYIEYEPPVIVPVGIHYSNYFSFQSKLFVQFGNPIYTKEYFDQYQTNNARGITILKQKLTDELKGLIINIECGEYYENVNFIRQLLRPNFAKAFNINLKDPWAEFKTDKIFTEKCNAYFNSRDQKFLEFAKLSETFKEHLRLYHLSPKKINLPDSNLFKISILIFVLIFLFPVICVGPIIYWLFKKLAQKINARIDDAQFHSTTKFAILLITVPAILILLMLIIKTLNYNWAIKFLLLFGIITSMVLSHWYVTIFSKTMNYWKFLNKKRKNDPILGLAKKNTEMSNGLF